MTKIFIHEDHPFKLYPNQIYYHKYLNIETELGTFIKNDKAWDAGFNGSGDGCCEFSNFTFGRECPYSNVYYIGEKPTPGTTIGPEYQFRKYIERVYYQMDNTSKETYLGKALSYSYPYNAGLNGSSNGYTIFENKKFEHYDSRFIQPISNKVYYYNS